jgi:hypothetical protein
MTTKQMSVDFPEVQAAIYAVALSLDAFLLNGIQYGVLQQAVFPGFLQKTAGNLTRDLARLQEQAPHAPVGGQPRTAELLAALRSRCQELIDLVTALLSFKALSLQEVRSTVSRVPHVHGECVRLIQELEACLGSPNPFYQSRLSHSTAGVNDFLANLERVFSEAWAATEIRP